MLMGLRLTPITSVLGVVGLALGATLAFNAIRGPAEDGWVGSLRARADTRHHHPRMDGDTLLSITPQEGRFATRMHAWFPLYDRLEARGLVEVERRDGMYVVRRLVANCPAVFGDAHGARCG